MTIWSCGAAWTTAIFLSCEAPIESIRESVAVSNRFLGYIGVAVVLVGVVIISFISKRITEPILQLAGISRKMSELDFETRYEGKEKNEIGILGNNINEMAEKPGAGHLGTEDSQQ